MLTLNKILNQVEFTENEHSFLVPTLIFSERLFLFLQNIEGTLSSFNLGHIIIVDEYGYDIILTDKYDTSKTGISFRLNVVKNDSIPLFFTETAFKKHIKDRNVLLEYYLLVFQYEAFQTDEVLFLGRSDIVLGKHKILKKRYSPTGNNTKIVTSLNDEAIQFLPFNTLQWIVSEDRTVPDVWKDVATSKLLVTIGSELVLRQNILEVIFRGERRVTLKVDINNSAWLRNSYNSINTTCKWIFSEGKDLETRHLIFNNQVCNLSIADEGNFEKKSAKIFERSLESAELAYRYYLFNSNKDLNRSLIEINKTLFEHINKIRQNTTDIVNGLWRDFTTAFGLLILNFSLKKPDISGRYWAILLEGLIIYLIVSYYLSASVGFWFYRRLKASLSDMKDRVYSYLTQEDFKKFALLPLENAQHKFIRTFWIVMVCYVAIVVLVIFSIKANQQPKVESYFKFALNS